MSIYMSRNKTFKKLSYKLLNICKFWNNKYYVSLCKSIGICPQIPIDIQDKCLLLKVYY